MPLLFLQKMNFILDNGRIPNSWTGTYIVYRFKWINGRECGSKVRNLQSYNLKENFFKMMYCWNVTPDKLYEMYKSTSNYVGKVKKILEHFIMHGGLIKKLKDIEYNYIWCCREF